MNSPTEDEAPEQSAWAKLGGLGSFDSLIDALGAVQGVALDIHRRVRLAVVLADLARRGLKFRECEDAANVLLPLIVLTPEARGAATAALKSHWSANASDVRDKSKLRTSRPGLVDWIRAVGASTWLVLLGIALIAAVVVALLESGGGHVTVPTVAIVAKNSPQAGQFWDWLVTFFVDDLMFRINAVILVAAIGLLWWRRAHRALSQQLGRDRAPGRVLRTLRLEPPALLTTGAVRWAGRTLRRPIRLPGASIDVRRTVDATVKAAGFLTLVKRLEARTPDCLMLVDCVSWNDQLSMLAEALAKRLRDGGAEVRRYDFRGYPDVLEAVGRRYGGHPVLSIEALAQRHPGARVVIVGTGRGFFEPGDRTKLRTDGTLYGAPLDTPFFDPRGSPLVGRLRPRLLPAFAGPPILMTPTPLDRWGPAETILWQAGFEVVPLGSAEDLHFGLNVAAEALVSARPAVALDQRVATYATPGADPLLMLLETPDVTSDMPPPDPRFRLRLARGVVEYASARLGESVEDAEPVDIFEPDPLVVKSMAGIAALALFPRIEPALTSTLWRVATDQYPSLERLSRLARLPWFRDGSMPDWLRGDIARHVRTEMARLGRAERWTRLRMALQTWTRQALEGDPNPDSVPIYQSTDDTESWTRLFRLWRNSSTTEKRAAVEERLFLTFLDSGEVVDDELSITLPRPDRPTPAMRLGILGFAIVAFALATLGPWLLWKASAAVPLPKNGQTSSVFLSLITLSWISAIGITLLRIAHIESIEGGARSGWLWSALGVSISVALAQLAVVINGRTSLLDWIICFPFAAAVTIFPMRRRTRKFQDMSATILLVSILIAIIFHTGNYFTRDEWIFNSFVIIFVGILLCGISSGSEYWILAFSIHMATFIWLLPYCLFVTVLTIISLLSIIAIPTPVEDVATFIAPLIYAAMMGTFMSGLYMEPTSYWQPRATFLGVAFLTIVALLKLFAIFPSIFPSWIAGTLGVLTVACIYLIWIGPMFIQLRSRVMRAWSNFSKYLNSISNPVPAVFYAAAVSFCFAAPAALGLKGALSPLPEVALWARFSRDSIVVFLSAALLTSIAFSLFPSSRTQTERGKAERRTAGLNILLLLWGVALAPDNLFASFLQSSFWHDYIGTKIQAPVPACPSLAWLALPLALHFLAKDGSRVTGTVLVGLLPFLAPITVYGIASPGGFWAIGLTLMLASWIGDPQRIAWLRPSSRNSVPWDAGLLEPGRLLTFFTAKLSEWMQSPRRLAAERLALAGGAAAFVALLAPQVSIAGGLQGNPTFAIDPQPLRAALFFLLGATALPRWPVRAILVFLLTLASTYGPYHAQLADTTVRLKAGLTTAEALELFLAYEIVPLARWARGLTLEVATFVVFIVWSVVLGTLIVIPTPWNGELANRAPVALALFGVWYGLALYKAPLWTVTFGRTQQVKFNREILVLTLPLVLIFVARFTPLREVWTQLLINVIFSERAPDLPQYVAIFTFIVCVLSATLLFGFVKVGERLAPLVIGDTRPSNPLLATSA